MEILKQDLDEIKKSNNPELINDFLLKLSEDPKKENLVHLKDLIEHLNPQMFNKVKLTLIFVLGEIGRLNSIDEYYLNFIFNIYHLSDRWVRNEIIQTIGKISKKSNLNENIIELIGNALNDDYDSIKSNALKILLNLETFPDSVFKNIFRVSNSKNTEILEACGRVLIKSFINVDRLFSLLTQSENYKILKPRAIRSLLLTHFKSIIHLESFRGNIVKSSWDEIYKENFLKEIDTFERILVKNM